MNPRTAEILSAAAAAKNCGLIHASDCISVRVAGSSVALVPSNAPHAVQFGMAVSMAVLASQAANSNRPDVRPVA